MCVIDLAETWWCKPGASMSAPPPPPLERTKGPPENLQKLSLAYVTAASETQHTVEFTPGTYGHHLPPSPPPHLEPTENPCNVMYELYMFDII